MNNYEKLINILREIFQIDQADLDFGIYRIMNQKREEIDDFLEHKLLPQVKEEIAKANLGDASAVQKELDEAIAGAKALGMNPNDVPKVQNLKAQLATTQPVTLIEEEVFSHLAAFFKRYYDKGDFISLRRYKKDVYAIPYEGEEVKLYWANHDQYYIKSSEYLKNYQFKVGTGRRVRFELVEASTEQNNNKAQNGKERQFRIFEDKPLEVVDGVLVIYFTYLPSEQKAKREDLNSTAFETIKAALPSDWMADVLQKVPTAKNADRTLLEKHINDFTARNTFDYFIHKDLGGFLRRELDFYIKNEVLHIDDINTEDTKDFTRQLTKIKALKVIADKVITFLEQLENFQKRLWLKKKFVVETNYCITLDKIPESYHQEIAENEAQWQEWEQLFAISEIEESSPNLFSMVMDKEIDYEKTKQGIPDKLKKQRVALIKNQPYLVLDTKFFCEDFKNRLLAAFDNLEEEIDGLLINSENFQALNLLQERFKGEIKSIYLDPPYNTGNDGFIYKDNLKESSWLTFMANRIGLLHNITGFDGSFFSSIDDNEIGNLQTLIANKYPQSQFVTNISVQLNPRGRTLDKYLAKTHEYITSFSLNSSNNSFYEITKSDDKLKDYKYEDDDGKYRLLELRNRNPVFNRQNRPNLYYAIYVNSENCSVSLSKDDKYSVEVYPRNSKGEDSCWTWGTTKFDKQKGELIARQTKKGDWRIFRKDRLLKNGEVATTKAKSVWIDKEINNENGKEILGNMFGQAPFSFPKAPRLIEKVFEISTVSDSIVIDYFAGSGTTGHAIINLNRKDGGKRKYILVEMGEYFNTVTKPRIQKVIYSADWKDGKPISRKGSSHIFKYIRLESYEDTLNNLRVIPKKEDKDVAKLFENDTFYEEYLLGYMLDTETSESLLSIKDFANPFNYQLTITENNEPKPTVVDMVETFNYLIGLKVATIKTIDGFRVVTGTKRTGEATLVIWRNTAEKDNDALCAFFEQYRAGEDFAAQHIYINGDNTVSNLQQESDTWKVYLTEKVFLQQMFDVQDV